MFTSQGLDDLWKLDVRNNYTWVNYTVAGDKPSPRGEALIWVDNNDNLFIFGGSNNSSIDSFITLSDLWMFNSTTMTWELLQNESDIVRGGLGNGTTETHPGPRVGSACWSGNDNDLWLYGGMGSPNIFVYADVWKYSLTKKIWTWMSGQKDTGVAPTNDVRLNTPSTTALPGASYGAGVTKDTDGNVW